MSRVGAVLRLGPRGVLRAAHRKLFLPRPGEVDFGDLGTLEPISRLFGYERGTPIDRVYIADFLAKNRESIKGRCLEVADREYTTAFGGSKVSQSDVLYAAGVEDAHAEAATIVGDLTHLDSVDDNTYDCLIVTQTLQFIYDFHAAIAEMERILKPGGVCLCTIPALSQISRYDMDRWGEYWRMTSLGAQRSFGQAFGEVSVTTCGNVYAAISMLQGLSAEEATGSDLMYSDPDYELIVCVRACKREN